MGSPEKPIAVEMGDMSEEAKLNPNPEKSDQIKENGDVKEKRFTGLKKEDLLKISNQPKWVRARWALFIIFWIVWIAMLVGAILIVVNAPRCKPEPKPQWYQDTVVYELNAEEFGKGLEGAKEYLPYVTNNLHARTILLTGASSPSNPAAVNGENETEFTDFVKVLHEDSKEPGYVVVDIIVDSLPTSSSEFTESASSNCANGNAGKNCDLLIWRDGNDSVEGWQYVETRKAAYKVADTDRAVINYSSQNAFNYIISVIREWFGRDVDGIRIRDLAKVVNVTQEVFLETLWSDDVFQNNTERALFVYSSSPNAALTPVELEANDTNTKHSPVLLTARLADMNVVNQSESGANMEKIIKEWREQSRNIAGYVVSPTDKNLAAVRFDYFAAGLNLLSMALPGVPILRSGDELVATSPVFSWVKDGSGDLVPSNGSEVIRKQTKELIVRRVAGIQAEPSLRFDTRDNDTTFVFLNTGNKDIIAFVRKWDQKGAILVVSNMSPNNHVVNLVVENGLKTGEKLSKKAQILITSVSGIESPVDLTKLTLNSGATFILKNV